jgi:hypothetical protein
MLNSGEDMADIQIDYEYPKTSSEATAYVQLLAELRQGLEQLAQQKGRNRGQSQLTIAAPCGAENMKVLRVKEMDQYLDFWNLMVCPPLPTELTIRHTMYVKTPNQKRRSRRLMIVCRIMGFGIRSPSESIHR